MAVEFSCKTNTNECELKGKVTTKCSCFQARCKELTEGEAIGKKGGRGGGGRKRTLSFLDPKKQMERPTRTKMNMEKVCRTALYCNQWTFKSPYI